MHQIHGGTWGGYVTHRPTTTLMIDGGTWGGYVWRRMGGVRLSFDTGMHAPKGGVYKADRLPVPPPFAAVIEKE